jgi:hypothetical protein
MLASWGRIHPLARNSSPYETVCSRGHHLKFIFAKKVLKAKLDKGEVTFFCYDCDRVWEASSEQKIELRNLAMS